MKTTKNRRYARLFFSYLIIAFFVVDHCVPSFVDDRCEF